MFITAISLFVAFSSQSYEAPSKTLFCYRELGISSKPRVSARTELEVDRDHDLIASRLKAFAPGFTGIWNMEHDESGVRLAIRELNVKPWPLPRDAKFPITVDVIVDGVVAETHSYVRRTTTIHDLINDPQRPRSDPEWPLTIGSPAVSLPKSLQLTTLFGAKSAALIVKDRDGAEVSRTALELPDWERLRTFADASLPSLEQSRRRKECRSTVTNVIFD